MNFDSAARIPFSAVLALSLFSGDTAALWACLNPRLGSVNGSYPFMCLLLQLDSEHVDNQSAAWSLCSVYVQ